MKYIIVLDDIFLMMMMGSQRPVLRVTVKMMTIHRKHNPLERRNGEKR